MPMVSRDYHVSVDGKDVFVGSFKTSQAVYVGVVRTLNLFDFPKAPVVTISSSPDVKDLMI